MCVFTITCRLCLLLLVEGASAYSDDVTTSFRRLAKESGAGRAGWGYVDTSKQSDFLQSFGPIPTDLKQCPDGSLARPVGGGWWVHARRVCCYSV